MKKQDIKQQSDQPTVKKQDQELEQAKREIEEWKNKYLRALADYQNLEKRSRSEKEEAWKYGSETILNRLFPVIDTFRKVKEHVKDVGLDLAYKELLTVLDEYAVEHIEVTGKEFDPHKMECIEVIEGKDNIVIEELLPGYTLHGKILRVAQVKVGKVKIS